ncbi:MAG TPA: MHYT domain-containing protein [Azospirillaceae bacterium]|nr:MHYT domain-containing protein [Azospirillaceae bacterium]
MHGHFDLDLVALSLLIAVMAAYAGLDLAGRVRQAEGGRRLVWLAAAAGALGGGIWSMHFVGMLALHLSWPVHYDPAVTLASLLLPVGIVGWALSVVVRGEPKLRHVLTAGTAMGLSIVSMHYLGMAAMRMPARTSYDPGLVALSVALAIGASTAALHLAVQPARPRSRALSALVMGIAICSMHYTGMAAARFEPVESASLAPGFDHQSLALGVGAVTLLILMGALVAAAMERATLERRAREVEERLGLVASLANAARLETEMRFRLAVEAAHIGIWDWNLETGVLQWSDEMRALMGVGPEALVTGDSWQRLVHPDDLDRLRRHIRDALDPCLALEQRTDFRAVLGNGTVRWLSARGRAVFRDEAGGRRAVRLLGTVQDVTKEKSLEGDLRASLAEKEVLLREVHHRVKNNLQSVSAILQLERSRLAHLPEVAGPLDSLAQRINVMGRVHQQLYSRDDFARVDLGQQLRVLASDLVSLHAAADMIDLRVAAEPVQADLDTAMPFGLIANELISNALKYGVSLQSGGRVEVALRREGADLLLLVENAVVPAAASDSGIGMRLVRALAAQLEGQLSVERGDVLHRATLRWPAVRATAGMDAPVGALAPTA